MPRQRYQRGTLKTGVPGNAARPERKLPRGYYWAQWYRYERQPDGAEKRRRREKIINRELAEKHRIAKDYAGPLTKTDAQRVLDLLIAQDSGVYIPPDTEATFAAVGREYMELSKPNWGPHMVRAACNLIEKHLLNGVLGNRSVVGLTHVEMQTWINGYVQASASSSLLKGLLYHARAILEHAIDRGIIQRNPARKLKAKSKKRPSERVLTMDECRRLLSVVAGADHLILRILIQLGLRSEELFALRRDDVREDMLRIDEALVEGHDAPVKTEASADSVYVPPDLQVELGEWLASVGPSQRDWLFPSPKGHPWGLQNYLNRRLKPAAIRARVGITTRRTKKGVEVESTDVNFQALRRTCATLFGAKAKDPRDTQAQLRHADPAVTLKHYQKSIPANVKTAAIAFEAELNRTGLEQVEATKTAVVN